MLYSFEYYYSIKKDHPDMIQDGLLTTNHNYKKTTYL